VPVKTQGVISAEVSAQLLQALLDLLHCDPPSLVPTDSPSTLPAGELLRPRIKCGAWKLSRDRATQTDTDLLCFAGIGTSIASRSRAASCSVVWGVRVSPHRALGALSPRCTWWRPRYAQKNLVRACASSPEISQGVAMESCLLGPRGFGLSQKKKNRVRGVGPRSWGPGGKPRRRGSHGVGMGLTWG
jgi:hypothetical protein